jgi:hypothetical protein
MTATRVRTSMQSSSSGGGERRDAAGSIGLHWTIAVLILVQIGLGWYKIIVVPDHTPAQAPSSGSLYRSA